MCPIISNRMKRFFLFPAVCPLLLSGCSKVGFFFRGDLPSAIVLEKVDLSGAMSLAVMDVPAESKEATKALTTAINWMPPDWTDKS